MDKIWFNETKYKELRINFNTNNTLFDPVVVNGIPIDLVARAKILGFRTWKLLDK